MSTTRAFSGQPFLPPSMGCSPQSRSGAAPRDALPSVLHGCVFAPRAPLHHCPCATPLQRQQVISTLLHLVLLRLQLPPRHILIHLHSSILHFPLHQSPLAVR